MKIVNKVIYQNILEIVFCLIIIVVTYAVWSFFPRDMIEIARIYDKSSLAYVSVDGYQNYKFYPMKDESSFKFLQPMNVALKNETNISFPYHVVFRISKDSTLNTKYLRYSIDNQIYSLANQFYKEDALYRYYLIDEGEIGAGNKYYSIRLWLSEDTAEEEIGHILKYSIINLDNIIDV